MFILGTSVDCTCFTIMQKLVHSYNAPKEHMDDPSAEEMSLLAQHGGSFDWLADPEEDIYTLADGKSTLWPEKSERR